MVSTSMGADWLRSDAAPATACNWCDRGTDHRRVATLECTPVFHSELHQSTSGGAMAVRVVIQGEHVSIERDVFVLLFDNSIAHARAPYRHALDRGEISYADLTTLARAARIPVALFFAPKSVVEVQVDLKTRKLLAGLTKKSFSLNVRDAVPLRDVELILEDLIRKQELLKRHDSTLALNRIVGALSKRGDSAEADAATLSEMLGITQETIRAAPKKDTAVDRLIRRLEANQVLVSQSQNTFMPQRLHGVHFSGMTVKDPKVPYIFLPSGDEGESVSPAGRRTFTLMLLTVLVARGIFAPVNYSSTATPTTGKYEYDVTAEILMPNKEFKLARTRNRADFEALADEYKVTPSAAIVRALRLDKIDESSAGLLLAELRSEFRKLPKQPRNPSKPVNGVRRYNGRELSWRMLRALDEGKITQGDFFREVCLNNIVPAELDEFRRSLR